MPHHCAGLRHCSSLVHQFGQPAHRALPVGVQLVAERCQSHRVEPVDAAGAFGPLIDQASVLQHLQMLGHGGPRHRQRRGQLSDGMGPFGQTGHDAAAGSVGQGVPAVLSVSNH
jgi:hypothetical protein